MFIKIYTKVTSQLTIAVKYPSFFLKVASGQGGKLRLVYLPQVFGKRKTD
ncbi:MAG: hypothetical protein IPJ81_13640 [Chitinophagaceae bacterium]|nr:hypothetical protein [Chitinophagaceae bacterium]